MREIKFRGKSIHSDEWCFGNLVNYGDGECEIQGFDVFREGKDKWQEITVDYNTVGQFTGLHDANGKEIYEGDIIESSFGGGIPARHFVGYDEKEAAFTANLIGAYPNSGGIRQSWIDQYGKKVVGNIFDTPELLKGGDK